MTEFEGLEVLKVQLPGLNPTGGAHDINAFELAQYLLGQECVNTDLLLHKEER